MQNMIRSMLHCSVWFRSLTYCSVPRFKSLASLQLIYVTRDHVILKFEARVQIYEAVFNIGCKIQNSGGNVVSFSKINSYEISF